MPGRDALALLAALDWTAIVVAIITLIGTMGSALIGAVVLYVLRTPSGTPIGKQIESVNHTTLMNHHRIVALAKRLQAIDHEDEA